MADLDRIVADLGQRLAELKAELHRRSDRGKDEERKRPPSEGPPQEVKDLCAQLEGKAGTALTWMGVFDVPGENHTSWLWSDAVAFDDPEDPIHNCPASNVERMLSPLAHAQRIEIMRALLGKHLAASGLTAQIGLTGGNLYHHLKELMFAGYVTQKENGKYALTGDGRRMIITMLHIAHKMVRDEGERGLMLHGMWREPAESPQEAANR